MYFPSGVGHSFPVRSWLKTLQVESLKKEGGKNQRTTLPFYPPLIMLGKPSHPLWQLCLLMWTPVLCLGDASPHLFAF